MAKKAKVTIDSFTDQIPSNYKVRITFRGFVMTKINHGAETALIGALAPIVDRCHQPKIHVYKVYGNGDTTEVRVPVIDDPYGKDFYLTVSGAPGGIQKFQLDDRPFLRHDEIHTSRKDIRWFTDLDEIHYKPVEVDEDQLHPKLIMNKGVFYTSARSDGAVMISLAKSSDLVTHFGKFALEISARINLDPGTNCVFLYDRVPIFLVDADPTPPPSPRPSDWFFYDIIYDCTCRADNEEGQSDFGLVYQVITNIGPDQQLSLEPEDHGVDPVRVTAGSAEFVLSPETYCVGGNYGG